jgi:hypothetical protein
LKWLSKGVELSCICVLEISIFPFSTIFLLYFRSFPSVISYYMKINFPMYDISCLRWMKRKQIIYVNINKSHHGYSCTYEPVRKLTKQNEIWTNLRTNFLIKINPRKKVNYVLIFNAWLTISQNHHQHEHDNIHVITCELY